MKKTRSTSGTRKAFMPKVRNHALLSALAAAGLISQIPTLAATLPTACSGTCGPSANLAFVGAGSATYTTNASATIGTINQTTQTAILNWQNFNIASGNSVKFVQPNSTASALNRIWDANPTMIDGGLSANGQLYLVNQNGVIFGNGAQVSAATLIASSLDIKDSLYQAGYLTNVSGTPDFTGTGGFVRVDTGATLNGSRIMLFAPVVENNGNISTPDGQTVLAAGNSVYLEASQDPNLRGVLVEVDVANPGQASSALSGLVQNNASGTVTNGAPGNILSQRGNITLVGYAVNQEGLLSATTAVNENGTVKLEARYNVAPPTQATSNPYLAESAGVANAYDIRATQTGPVTLASGSAITIAPETGSTATVTASQGFNPSIVEVMGSTIDMQSGSSIIAPGGKVTLAALSSIDPSAQAGINNNVYQTVDSSYALSSFLNPDYLPTPNAAGDAARVFLDSGSKIDVSGSTASVSVAQDILAVQLRGAELADAPLQKTGPLYGQTVYVDIRQGTPLANYSGEEAQIPLGVAQLTSSGGNVNLYSTGDVVAKTGSSVNISSGQVDYTGAYVNTTSLISATGAVYDIAKASPDIVYDGIVGSYAVSSAKWGMTQTFNTMAGGDVRSRWDPGYVEGQAAGTVTVMAPNSVLDGSIVAKTVAGIYQTKPYIDLATSGQPLLYSDTYQMLPSGGALVIGDSGAVLDPITSKYNYVTDANVVFQPDPNPLPAGFAPGDALSQTKAIYLDQALWSGTNGVDQVGVYTNGTVTVNPGTSLTLAAGGSLTLRGDTVNMWGSINVPAGTVNLGSSETTASTGLIPGGISVGSAGTGSTISTRGVWVNDSPLVGGVGSTDPVYINGGNITITSGGNLSVAAGTVIDASGGGMVDASNNIHGGNGGLISITGNYNQSINPYVGQLDNLDLASYGVAGGKGGALTLDAGDIVIGGSGPNALDIPVGFFSSGGFTSYTLGAIGGQHGLDIASGAVIAPQNQTLILDNNALQMASGANIYSFSQSGQLPDWQRDPVSITLKQIGGGLGSLTVGSGAAIQVDPTASINLASDTQLTVLGTLDAPAGNIDLTLNSVAPQIGFNNGNSTLWLGSQSELLAQGTTVLTPNAKGLQQGQVLPGGKIDLTSNMFVVSQQGSVMDVSGTAASLDLPQLESGSVVYRSSLVAGNAGSITVTATEGALLDGALNAGVAPGSTAAAGSFALTLAGMLASDRTALTTFPQTPPWEISVDTSASGSSITLPGNDSMAGMANLTAVDGMAYVNASALKQAGFDQVSLTSSNGAISLSDQVALDAMRSVMLDAPTIALAGSSAAISASYVNLANSNLQHQTVIPPSAGTGTLSVSAQLVDITGNLAVSGVGQLSVTSDGDIRLNGVLNTAGTLLAGSLVTQGNVTLQANQVYPTTMSQFALSVIDGSANPAGTITLHPNNSASPASGLSPVLSAGGEVTLSAATINQDGVLQAPMGSITLDGAQNVSLGPGSLTSVSAYGQTIPFGSVLGGTGWIYNLTGSAAGAASGANLPFGTVAVSAPPQKQINIQGSNVAINNDAVVNLSGGGDLYGNEFIPGTGGSVNVLDPTQGPANTYAVIPDMTGFGPYDPQLAGQYAASGSKSALSVGSQVYLAGGDGLSAGYYALLPASYALLPGAYMVTMVAGHQDMLPGQGGIQVPGGAEIMAGKLAVAGTSILDARWSGFEVAPGSMARSESQFQDSYANSFFASQAAANGTATPALPIDAGQLVVTANGNGATLALDGTMVAQPAAGGRGAQVDLNVVGGGFDIVNGTASDANNLVQLDANALSKLGVDSLLIGGVRSQSASGTTIAVGASDVQVDNAGSVLSGPEIILAATNAVNVTSGSSIQASGTFTGQANDLTIGTSGGASGDGALLRVSSGPQATVTRNNLLGSTPTLSVESGAMVGGTSVLLDSSSATNIGSGAQLSAASFSVSAQNIAIGNATSTASSTLLLTTSLLNQLTGLQDLTLHSYGDIDFFGAASLGGVGAPIGNLTLNAQSISGNYDAGMNNASNVVTASSVILMNNNGTTSATPNGTGELTLNAGSIAMAGGNLAIQGYDTVTLNTPGEIQGKGSSGLTIVAPTDANSHTLQVNAGQITGSAGSNQTILASNYDISLGLNSGTTFAAPDSLGATLTVSGNSIMDAGIINLPSGAVMLNASGPASGDGVTLADGSQIIASGVAKTIAGQTAYAPAGSVSLSAANGGITLESGSAIDVSANPDGGNAGSIRLVATNGPMTVSGSLSGTASANGTAGSFTVDAGSLAGAGNALTALDDTLTAGGFDYLRDIRVRTGSLVLDADSGTSRAVAQNFTLEADAGSIDVVGSVDASGSNGGNILLAAQGNVTLENTALLDAHSTGQGQAGGNVTLETENGEINMMTPAAGSQIDVHSNSALQNNSSGGGTVLLHAPQTSGYTDVAVNSAAGTSLDVSSGADVTVEAFRQYTATGISASDVCACSTSAYYTDANTFANNAAAIKARLGMSLSDANMNLMPGIEIDSSGDLALNTSWDLSAWRFNDGTGALTEPGVLTLRAAGNLNLGSSISDGFQSANSFAPLTGPSWSYRLVAGADMASANVMAVDNTVSGNTGTVALAAGSDTISTTGASKGTTTVQTLNQVRTGTGFIDIAAGKDVNLGNRDSVIYTAGLAASGAPAYTYNGQGSIFPVGGGNISISADGNINGDASGALPVNQLVSEWQWRQGQAAANGTYIDPAWWINYGSFRQNVGALGGGNVTISAGGNINNLSAVVPTSGYVDSSGNTVVLGGGNLMVTAGGSVNSGIFYVGNGEGTIVAGGGLGATSSTNPIYTILLLGGSFNNTQTGFNVQTAGDLNLQTILNPTMLGYSFSQKPANSQISYFYTYDSAGNISLASLDGNIQLVDSVRTSNNGTAPFLMNTAGQPNTVYPASLEVTALDGTINNSGAAFQLFPSSTGNLQLFAGTDINLGAGFGMADMSPASLLAINSAGGTGHSPQVSSTAHGTVIDPATGLLVPVHANDPVPIIIVAGNDITGNGNTNIPILELPKQAEISAGQDIINVTADVQNQQPTDATSFVAGRDISFTSQEAAGITVSGPGQIVLQAGRNVDLGVSSGVVTEGSLNNPSLPSQGASITVLAGVGQDGADTQAFIDKYIDPAAGGAYGADLVAYVSGYGAPQNLTVAQAFAYFSAMPKTLQDAFVNQVLFDELRLSGRSAISTGDYSAGYAAIATLFPGTYSGNLTLYNSQIKTESGGDINIVTPGGGVNAGLASANTGKPASQIGVVTVGGGNINAFVNNDFTVNQSRVFTIQGGNILMWSSNGSIDAGNGSKTATSTPPPLLVVNPKTGEFSVDATASIVGSGIRVLLGNRNVVPGSVDLFAPTGVINAGDAGIGSAGNIYLGAQQVIGANNINFGGTGAGVPVATVAPVTVNGVNNMQDASKAAEQATQSMGTLNQDLDSFRPTFLSVEVIGLGSGDDCADLQPDHSQGCK
jgi:filamentous hemagglutinin